MSLLYQLVSVLGECGQSKPRDRSLPLGDEADPDMTRLGAALDAMRQYHFEPLDIADLAAKAHLSVSRFRAVFRRVMGVAPHRYIQSLRFDLAKGLLERGDDPIKVVAERVGYSNPYLFSRLFKRDVGTSPSEYRQLHRSRDGGNNHG
jgi:AraC-like DNA-binding protein